MTSDKDICPNRKAGGPFCFYFTYPLEDSDKPNAKRKCWWCDHIEGTPFEPEHYFMDKELKEKR